MGLSKRKPLEQKRGLKIKLKLWIIHDHNSIMAIVEFYQPYLYFLNLFLLIIIKSYFLYITLKRISYFEIFENNMFRLSSPFTRVLPQPKFKALKHYWPLYNFYSRMQEGKIMKVKNEIFVQNLMKLRIHILHFKNSGFFLE